MINPFAHVPKKDENEAGRTRDCSLFLGGAANDLYACSYMWGFPGWLRMGSHGVAVPTVRAVPTARPFAVVPWAQIRDTRGRQIRGFQLKPFDQTAAFRFP